LPPVSQNGTRPPEYIEAARLTLKEIDLDPASSKVAQHIVKAKRFYTAEDDGLSKNWRGRVWLNPPYAEGLVDQFMAKLCFHFKEESVPSAISLTNNSTETRWFQDALPYAHAICLPSGRIKFLDENGEACGAPLQGQAILLFGDLSLIPEFMDIFSQFGYCTELTDGKTEPAALGLRYGRVL
jgi:hypothetical protein